MILCSVRPGSPRCPPRSSTSRPATSVREGPAPAGSFPERLRPRPVGGDLRKSSSHGRQFLSFVARSQRKKTESLQDPDQSTRRHWPGPDVDLRRQPRDAFFELFRVRSVVLRERHASPAIAEVRLALQWSAIPSKRRCRPSRLSRQSTRTAARSRSSAPRPRTVPPERNPPRLLSAGPGRRGTGLRAWPASGYPRSSAPALGEAALREVG